MNLRKVIVVTALTLVVAVAAASAAHEGRLLRFPDVHGDKVVFVYGGDIWTAPTAGGTATRLTSHEGLEQFPKFSPDGRWIAFTGQYDGHNQVYVIPADGGEPRQLTFYPTTSFPERFGGDNMIYSWTPDGERVVFRSQREAFDVFIGRLYAVGLEGGMPEPLPPPISGSASFSPDGTRLAYNRVMRDFRPWKRYMGGMQQDVWIYNLADNSIERITDWGGTDNYPMWHGDTIYFNSDREHTLNIFAYDVVSGETTQVTHFDQYDVKFPSLGPGAIVFENGGYLNVLDLESGEITQLEITLPTDLPSTRPQYVNVTERIEDFDLGRAGRRAVFTARGEIFTVPAEHGDIRNLTQTPGVREKFAAWSPDGRWVAYMSDASGEDELYIRAADGSGEEIRLTEGADRTRFAPLWSPDSSKLVFSDKSLRLFYIDIEERELVQVDEATAGEIRDYAWSPDSRWIAYSKPADITGFRSLYLYSLEEGTPHQITGGYTHDDEPVFDADGKYLFFTSVRDFNPSFTLYEANFYFRNFGRIYAITLQADEPSPFAPRSDEVEVEVEDENGDEEESEEGEDEGIRIDLEGIADRIVGFPLEPGTYFGLSATSGKVFYFQGRESGPPSLNLYDLGEREEHTLLAPVMGYSLSPDGAKLLYRSGSTYGIINAAPGRYSVGDGRLDLSSMRMLRDPRAEWANSFNEVWRRARDFFYDPNMHGLDWPAMRERYVALLPYVSHRNDLTYILSEMVSELCCSHTYIGGGDQPQVERVGIGLLGATFEATESGFYRIAKIYVGENWHNDLRSPLTEPGVVAHEGDYVIAIDGTPLRTDANPYSLLANKADRTVVLTLNDEPTEEGAREVSVRPISDEWSLRYYNWVRDNRNYVSERTDGRVGYVHIPDMSTAGLREFAKWYYAQIDREGMIIDVRYNGGGFVSQMILERLRRILVGMGVSRNFGISTYPDNIFVGHQVCITNLYAASDGDIVSYFWREYGLGPLIGTRTWGGVIGIRGGPQLLDGGYFFVPEFATYGIDSQWIMENVGVTPDEVVDLLPVDFHAGRDPQLDRAIELVLEAMEREPRRRPEPPEYPIRD